MGWWWRTKPRSIMRTIQWFPLFGVLENKNWNEITPNVFSKKNHNKIHPVRRTYIYNAHCDEDARLCSMSLHDYLSGEFDIRETESNGRNDKTTFEFFGFGYVDKGGIIRVTDVGRSIINNKFDDEDFLKQLLKLHFPNNIEASKSFGINGYIYPLQLVCKSIKKFGYHLNRSELALLFGCDDINDINKAYKAIEDFRHNYEQLQNKNNQTKVKEIFLHAYTAAYGSPKNNINSYYDYAEALGRSLLYTGLFKSSGRSNATKIIVPQYSVSKLNMIIDRIKFEKKSFGSIDEYMEWYGATDNITLPWDSVEERQKIINEKIKVVNELRKTNLLNNYEGTNEKTVAKVISKARKLSNTASIVNLKDADKTLTNFIVNIKENDYIHNIAQTADARKEILQKYDDILGTIDMGALWLEVNTWKSLLALNGNKTVIRNFNIEEDLTPKSFAPGIGNTPDMEMRSGNFIVIPEVSLMTGVQQWEHEASSVIDHVLSFINNNSDKTVLGLFISTSINIRTQWQFFILNRESWVEKPVPVIPLTIKQYKGLLEVFYDKNLDVIAFIEVIDAISRIALGSQNYKEWFTKTEVFINCWKTKQITI